MSGIKRTVKEDEQAIVAGVVAQWSSACKDLLNALDMYPALIAYLRVVKQEEEFMEFLKTYWPELWTESFEGSAF